MRRRERCGYFGKRVAWGIANDLGKRVNDFFCRETLFAAPRAVKALPVGGSF